MPLCQFERKHDCFKNSTSGMNDHEKDGLLYVGEIKRTPEQIQKQDNPERQDKQTASKKKKKQDNHPSEKKTKKARDKSKKSKSDNQFTGLTSFAQFEQEFEERFQKEVSKVILY